MLRTRILLQNSIGTREALFSLITLMQMCQDQQKDAYLCVTYHEKTFDEVKNEKLL